MKPDKERIEETTPQERDECSETELKKVAGGQVQTQGPGFGPGIAQERTV